MKFKLSCLALLLTLLARLLNVGGVNAQQADGMQTTTGFAPSTAASLVQGAGGGGCFVTVLSGANETPPNGSTATGTSLFVLSPDQTKLTFHIEHSGIVTETAAHIHRGAVGVSGPISFTLPLGTPKDGTLTLTPQNASDLRAGLFYVNVHSSAFSGGEIRGQIVTTANCFVANLAGANETPPNTSTGTGIVIFALSADQTRLTYHVDYSGLSGAATAAHIHKGAVGVGGPIVFPLSTANPITGTQSLTPTNVADLWAGLYYVNIHTVAFSGGEIRGQIGPSSASVGNCFTAVLSGANETPPNASTGVGTGTFLLSPDQSKLSFYNEYSGLSSAVTAAHIHKGAVGIAGPIVFPLSATNPITGTQTLTPTNVADLSAGLYYVNIHTVSFSGGEIRGQLFPNANCFSAMLSGANETPPNSSTATGSGVFAMSPDQTKFTYHIEHSVIVTETAAHIHRGAIGVSGPISFTLPLGTPKDGTLMFTDQNVVDTLSGLYYVNVHSSAFSGGEIRGQILLALSKLYLPIVIK